MSAGLHPLQALLLTVSGWVNCHQQHVIEYLVEENRVLKEQLGGKPLRLNNDQRRRLAAKAKLFGRKALDGIATIVTPDTLMRWHRKLIALKWTHQAPRIGRPGLMKEIKGLIVRMATENSTWGYSRIQGELKGLGHKVARTTVANVLKENGIKPAPDRPSSWRSFLKAHWGQIAATDFFSVEVWTPVGLKTIYVLFVIDLESRRVHLAGLTTNPNEAFMAQVARNLTDCMDGFLRGHRFLICDRDTKFTKQFKQALKAAGVEVVLTPVMAPNCNATLSVSCSPSNLNARTG
jgi:putative transposase